MIAHHHAKIQTPKPGITNHSQHVENENSVHARPESIDNDRVQI